MTFQTVFRLEIFTGKYSKNWIRKSPQISFLFLFYFSAMWFSIFKLQNEEENGTDTKKTKQTEKKQEKNVIVCTRRQTFSIFFFIFFFCFHSFFFHFAKFSLIPHKLAKCNVRHLYVWLFCFISLLFFNTLFFFCRLLPLFYFKIFFETNGQNHVRFV